jgi:hypothetical protein
LLRGRNSCVSVHEERLLDAPSAHHAAVCSGVEPAQRGVGERQRYRPARAQVLRELGVIRGSEAQSATHAVLASGEAERPLRRNVHGLRAECIESLRHLSHRRDRNADFRVTGARKSAKGARLHEPDHVSEAPEAGRGMRERVHDAIGLRVPGVAHDHDSHARCARSITRSVDPATSPALTPSSETEIPGADIARTL